MSSFNLKTKAEQILAEAGISVNGRSDWDIKVKDEQLYPKVFAGGSLALGEAYMAGMWDCERLDEFFTRIFKADLSKHFNSPSMILHYLEAKLINMQSKSKAFEVGQKHYDLGNELYKAMLDKRMLYTCAYWKNAKNLDDAQEKKLKLTCDKLQLEKGMVLLDIGCGWGGLAKYAAENYGVSVVGITVSKNQASYAKTLCKGLPIEIRLQDYRQLNKKFDRIVSLGMLEHVGCKNYKTYMQVASSCLKDDGLFLLHTIGANISTNAIEPWLHKYIFPNATLPSIKQIGESLEKTFVMEDWHNFGPHYDKTLMSWFENFDKNWQKVKSKYGEKFYRMWKYYLLFSAATFRSRSNQLWQIVLSKGLEKGYNSIR